MVTIRDRTNNVGELKTIDSIRQHILDGNAYRAWDTSFNLAVDGSMNFAFIIPADITAKVKFFVEADQSTNLRIIEDASWNSPGVLLTAYNFNRNSANTMSCTLYKAPSMAGKWGSGTLISSKYAFAKSTTGGLGLGQTVFGTGSDEYSMVLASDTRYVFNIVNTGPAIGNIAVTMRITEGTV